MADIRLLSLEIADFKGIKNKVVDFTDKTIISGKNATGKTTIADAYFWLWSDKNYSLNSNPNIRPLGNEDSVVPTVTATMMIDNQKVIVTKKQVMKVGKEDANGIKKIALNNAWEVNTIPMAEKDMKEKLSELGFDFDKFLVYSHADFFNGMKMADERKTLFDMTKSYTDVEIAESIADKVPLVLAKLQEGFSIDEINSMNNRDKKKAQEQADAIPNQIIGLESAKVDYDVAELELQKKALEEQVADINVAKELEQKAFELEFEINDLKRKYKEESLKEYSASKDEVFDLKNKARKVEGDIADCNLKIKQYESEISSTKEENAKLGEQYQELATTSFDKNKTVCPTCNQILPQDKIDELVLNFEKDKREKMNRLIQLGDKNKANITNLGQLTMNLSKRKDEYSEILSSLNEKITQLEKSIGEEPVVDFESIEELNKLIEEQASLRKQAEETKVSDDADITKDSINEINKKLAQVEHNEKIDEQADALREELVKVNQLIADSENISYQIGLLNKQRNSLLTAEINKHFKYVDFELFTYNKSGEYKETCKATHEGKELGISTNTALTTLMKIDICSGLQKADDVSYPIFVDSAECFDSDNLSKLDFDNQLVAFRVSDAEMEILKC